MAPRADPARSDITRVCRTRSARHMTHAPPRPPLDAAGFRWSRARDRRDRSVNEGTRRLSAHHSPTSHPSGAGPTASRSNSCTLARARSGQPGVRSKSPISFGQSYSAGSYVGRSSVRCCSSHGGGGGASHGGLGRCVVRGASLDEDPMDPALGVDVVMMNARSRPSTSGVIGDGFNTCTAGEKNGFAGVILIFSRGYSKNTLLTGRHCATVHRGPQRFRSVRPSGGGAVKAAVVGGCHARHSFNTRVRTFLLAWPLALDVSWKALTPRSCVRARFVTAPSSIRSPAARRRAQRCVGEKRRHAAGTTNIVTDARQPRVGVVQSAAPTLGR